LTGQPQADHFRLPEVRSYLRAGRWDGTLPIDIDYRDYLAVSATYGLNYFVIRYLADRFGEATMLRLVDDLLRSGKPIENAAPGILGLPWSTLAADITTHPRRIAR
jgi:hypothetical protein